MRKGENPAVVLDAIKAKVELMNRSMLPKGVSIVPYYDRTWLLDKTLKTVFTNLVEGARRFGIKKFVQVGTICAYPNHTPVPFNESDLWNGYPEVTNAPYGVAKKALLVMCQSYRQQYGLNSIYLLPVNLYGPRDNFDLRTSHVIPALIRKCVEARDRGDASITAWGTGNVSREFLYVEDCAEGLVSAMERYDSPEPMNLGSGREITIRDLTVLVAQPARFEGEIVWDSTKPDGQPRRCLDVSRAFNAIGFRARTALEDGLRKTVEWYLANGEWVRNVQSGAYREWVEKQYDAAPAAKAAA